MKVRVVNIVKANEGREDIWRKILKDVELSRVSACMHARSLQVHCGGGLVTYRWDYVDIPITIECNWID